MCLPCPADVEPAELLMLLVLTFVRRVVRTSRLVTRARRVVPRKEIPEPAFVIVVESH